MENTAIPTARTFRTHALLIFIMGLIVYGGTFTAPFVFDETYYITDAPFAKDMSYFTSPEAAELNRISAFNRTLLGNRYLGYLSFAINHHLHGADVPGYHIINFAIHIVTALGVYGLILLLFDSPMLASSPHRPIARHIALIGGLVFVAHPVETQAVTYIAQRFASLAGMFSILALIAYMRARMTEDGARRITLYALSLLMALCATKSKETSIALPLLIAITEFMFFTGPARRRILLCLPYLAIASMVPLTVWWHMPGGASQASNPLGITHLTYLLTELRVMATYLRLMLLPVNQNLDYDYPMAGGAGELHVVLSLGLIAIVLAAGLIAYRKSRDNGMAAWRLPAFGIFWFFIALIPETGLMPLEDAIFEHRLYLPSVGLIVAAVGATAYCLNSHTDQTRSRALAILLSLLLLFPVAAIARNHVWQDRAALWQDTVMKSPGKTRAHNNLAFIYHERGRNDMAARELIESLRINDRQYEAHNNLGNIYMDAGQAELGLKEYKIALLIDNDRPDAHVNLGNAFLRLGRNAEAETEYLIAQRLAPQSEGAKAGLAITQGKPARP